MKELFKALAGFQSEVPTIHEATTGYNYTYSNLNTIFDVIKPLLTKHGLGFTQLLEGDGLKTILFHVKSGETIESIVTLPNDVQLKGMNQFQVNGSAITYYRRYSISAILGLITDKDIDGAGESKPPVKAKTTPPKKEAVKKPVILSDANITSAITKGNQQLVLDGIKDGTYTATDEQVIDLNESLKA